MTTVTHDRGTTLPAAERDRLRRIAVRRFEHSIDTPIRFVHDHASLIARACLEMANRFERGGRLLAFGAGPAATDARHVAVEFVHPVIVGKRALPAIALVNDVSGPHGRFERALDTLGHENDIALGIDDANASEFAPALQRARAFGMLTIALAGANAEVTADFVFSVQTSDTLVVQEVHELLYHVLWELVHVFLEHRTAS